METSILCNLHMGTILGSSKITTNGWISILETMYIIGLDKKSYLHFFNIYLDCVCVSFKGLTKCIIKEHGLNKMRRGIDEIFEHV